MSKTRCSYDIVNFVYFMLISYIHFYYKESILRRHRFDIVTISSCHCLINCIAVDIIDIDTISSYSSWIHCFAIYIVDIIDIDSILIRYRFMIVGLSVLLSISIRYRHVSVGSTVLLSISLISIRYCHVLVFLVFLSISIRYPHDIVS